MGEKDKTEEDTPEEQGRTAISDEEKKRIKEKHGSHVLSEEEWNKEMNKYDDKSKYSKS